MKMNFFFQFIMFVFLLFTVLSCSFPWFDSMKIVILMEFLSVTMAIFIINNVLWLYLSETYFIIVLVWLVCEASLSFVLFVFFMSFSYEMVGKFLLMEL